MPPAWRRGGWSGRTSPCPLFEAGLAGGPDHLGAARRHRLLGGAGPFAIGNPAEYMRWMLRAADERRTFYGLLARRTLGLDICFAPGGRQAHETLGEADIEADRRHPEGLPRLRALQVGQDHRAEAELRRLWPMAETAPRSAVP